MIQQQRAYLFAGLTVLLWSTVASAFKISLRYLDSFQLLLVSSFFSFISIFVIICLKGRLKYLFTTGKRGVLRSALLGFVNPFLYYVFLFQAYTMLPAQEVQAINYTWPIMLVLLSIPLLKQSIKPISILATIISFIGIFIISTRGNLLDFSFTDISGIIISILTAVLWAVFWILDVNDKRDGLIKLFYNFLFGFIYILITTIIKSDLPQLTLKSTLAASYVGLFEMGITFVLWSKALSLSVTTAKVSRFIYLVPFISIIIIHFVVGEDIYISTLIGLCFIVIGIIFEQVVKNRK